MGFVRGDAGTNQMVKRDRRCVKLGHGFAPEERLADRSRQGPPGTAEAGTRKRRRDLLKWNSPSGKQDNLNDSKGCRYRETSPSMVEEATPLPAGCSLVPPGWICAAPPRGSRGRGGA